MSRFQQLLRFKRVLRKRKVALAAAVFLSAFALRYYHLDHRSIWMDEDAQARNASTGFNIGLVYKAASQQQPPLDYMFEKIGLTVFGWTEIGARIHAALLGSAAAAVFFLLVTTLVRRPGAVFFGTLLFITHPLLIRYGQEGRPISCGVFFALLWLLSVIKLIRKANSIVEAALLKNLAPVFISCFLFILSVGFQPLVFLAVFAAAFLPCAYFGKLPRRKTGLIFGAIFAASVAASPILLLTLKAGAAYVKPTALPEKAASLLNALLHLDFKEWFGRLDELMGHLLFFFAAVSVPALLGIAEKIRRKKLGRSAAFHLVFFLLFSVLFPIFFNALYYGLIPKHRPVARYFLSVVPVLLIFLTMLLSEAEEFLSGKCTRRSKTVSRAVYAVAALTLTAMVASPTASALKFQYNETEHRDWRSVYNLFKQDPHATGVAYLMNLIPVDRWGPVRFYGTNFYYRTEDARPILLKKIDNLVSDVARGALESGDRLYLVVPYGYEAIPKEALRKFNAQFYQFTKMTVLHITLGTEPEKDVLSLFDRLASKADKTQQNFKIFEVQAALKILFHDDKSAQRIIKLLAEMDTDGSLHKKVIPSLNQARKRARDD